MTICIAARSLDDCFVAVTDRLLSLVTPEQDVPGVEDATAKAFDVGWGWHAVAAGNIGLAKPIVLRARQVLEEIQPAGRAARAQMCRALKAGYRRVRNERIYEEILAPRGLNWRRYRTGPVDEHLRDEIAGKIDAYWLPVELLLFGTSGDYFQHFVEVQDPGVIEDRIYLGYWAIGSAAKAALQVLPIHLTKRLPHHQLIYRLCEAKFCCENADGVGRETNVLVSSSMGHLWQLRPEYIDRLRIIWDRERRSLPPPDAIEVIDEAIQRARLE